MLPSSGPEHGVSMFARNVGVYLQVRTDYIPEDKHRHNSILVSLGMYLCS
jgi:hypothetical protein